MHEPERVTAFEHGNGVIEADREGEEVGDGQRLAQLVPAACVREPHRMTAKRPLVTATAIALLLTASAISSEELAAQAAPSADAAAGRAGARGVLGGYEYGRVWGWAQIIGHDTPVRVRVEVDGRTVATLLADQARGDLVDKGLHRSGRAGFSGFIGDVPVGARVEAFVEETGDRLTNSPCVVQGHGPVSSCTEGTSRGALGGYARGHVWGWAQLVGHEAPVIVRVEVDGTPVVTTLADHPRPDLVAQHLHPSGRAGFRVEVGQLPDGAAITAFIDETGEPLMSTPLLVRTSGSTR